VTITAGTHEAVVRQAYMAIAHDLNNALSGIALYTELLIDESSDRPETLSDLGEVARAVNSAQRLVERLYSLAGKLDSDGVDPRFQSVILTPDANPGNGRGRPQGNG
jgi:signal transduction histidine kinase